MQPPQLRVQLWCQSVCPNDQTASIRLHSVAWENPASSQRCPETSVPCRKFHLAPGGCGTTRTDRIRCFKRYLQSRALPGAKRLPWDARRQISASLVPVGTTGEVSRQEAWLLWLCRRMQLLWQKFQRPAVLHCWEIRRQWERHWDWWVW